MNVCWGIFNVVVGYILVSKVGDFDLKSAPDVAASLLGGLLISLFSARHFGRFNGGNLAERK